MNNKSKYLVVFFLLTLILTACGPSAPTPAAIVQGFWDAVIAKDIDAAMAFVADDVQISGGPFSNLEDKANFSAFMSSETKRGATFEIGNLKVSGDTVTFDQKVYDNGSLIASGSSIFQVNNDGKIVLMKFTN